MEGGSGEVLWVYDWGLREEGVLQGCVRVVGGVAWLEKGERQHGVIIEDSYWKIGAVGPSRVSREASPHGAFGAGSVEAPELNQEQVQSLGHHVH